MAINWEDYYKAVLANPTAREESKQKASTALGQTATTPTTTPTTAPTTPAVTSGSYTVKKGDTLSGIAKQLGLPGYSSLTGYRSGNPNLIYPGEVLSYQTPGGSQEGFQNAYQETQTPATRESVVAEFPSMADQMRTEYDTARQSRDQARQTLENARTNLFNQEYEKLGLNVTKEKIKSLDETIAELNTRREEDVLTARRNPNISAGVLAGDRGKLEDYYNGLINTEINKRNALAEEYNRSLDEVESRVMNGISDLAMQYDHWNSVVSEMERSRARYEDILREELSDKEAKERWEKEFGLKQSQFEKELAQRLAIANIKDDPKTENVKLERVERKKQYGGATGIIDWYNPYTGELVKTTGE